MKKLVLVVYQIELKRQILRLLHNKKQVSHLIILFEKIKNLFLGDPLVICILTILGAFCAFILILPTIPDNENTYFPSYLHMTTNSKVIASYILGKYLYLFSFF